MTLDGANLESLTWPLVTLIPALAQPQEHVAVQHRPFALQARSLDPSAAVPKAPSPIGYSRFQSRSHRPGPSGAARSHSGRPHRRPWLHLGDPRPRGVQTLDQISRTGRFLRGSPAPASPQGRRRLRSERRPADEQFRNAPTLRRTGIHRPVIMT